MALLLVTAAFLGMFVTAATAQAQTEGDMSEEMPAEMSDEMPMVSEEIPAEMPEEMPMVSDAGMASSTGMVGMAPFDSSDLFNQINTVAYPVTLLMTLFVGLVSFRLIRLTNQTDKFALVVLGMAFLFVQAILGTLFYVSQADIVSMTTVMFWGGLLTSLAMASVGVGFYRWMRMLA